MFLPTHQLRITTPESSVRFRGFTKARFKTLFVDPAEESGAIMKFNSYSHKMNQDLVDLADRDVQRALDICIDYARDAATAAAQYFAKRPTRFSTLNRMEKIFERHFKLRAPSDEQRLEVQRTFERTAAGLASDIEITDLFVGADLYGDNGGLFWGSEGQVAFDKDTDDAYMGTMRALEADEVDERKNDVMREFLQRAGKLDIYLDFSLLRKSNKQQMARVIVHEATHKFAFTGDYGYMSDDRAFFRMTGADAIRNADSYAYAAISVMEASALTPEKIARLGTRLLNRR
jgi:hypothetical protein